MKFRYFDNVTNNFVYSEEFDFSNKLEQLERFFAKAKNYTDTVDQCINQKDKFGKDIYFNDILFVPAGFSVDYWSPESLVLVDYFYDDSIPGPDDIYWVDMEIIGNNYQDSTMIDYVYSYIKINNIKKYLIKDILKGYYDIRTKEIF